MIQTLANWLTTSDNMLLTIQEKIKWADTMSELNQKHTKELEEKTEEMKSSIKEALHGHEELSYSKSGGVMDYDEDRSQQNTSWQPKSDNVLAILKHFEKQGDVQAATTGILANLPASDSKLLLL